MDQVKKIGRILLEQRFWILCGVVTLLPVGGWFTTTSQMNKLTEERRAAIKSKVDAAQGLLNKQNHPNDLSHQAMESLRNRVTSEVGEAWRLQYERQRQLLVWPAGLLDDFISVVDPLRPLEKVQPPTSAADEVLVVPLRERYRNYIAEELPKLADKIGAVWHIQEQVEGTNPNSQFQAGAAGTGVMTPQKVEKVVWNPSDQTALRARYDWSNTRQRVPRSIDILYAQEDLWIMSALMDIIATTNQTATARYNAVVKEISYINLGRDVGGSTGRVMRIGGMAEGGMEGGGMMPGGAGMMPGGSGMMPGGSGMMMPGGEGMEPESGSGGGMMPGGEGGMMPGGVGGMGGAMGPADPAEFRYVDQNYQPIPASTLRTVITSDTQDPNNAFLVVAKRIPIRLGLTIDQRKLNRFIAACGNAPLMFEVRQVRFNRQGGSTASAGGGGMMGGMGGLMGSSGGYGGRGEGDSGGLAGMMPGGSGAGFGGGMMPGGSGFAGMEGGGGYAAGGGDPAQAASDVSPHDKPVEVYGIVYIYNPVDVKKLAIDKADAETDPTAAPPPDPAAAAAAAPAPAVAAPAAPADPNAAGGVPPGVAAPGAVPGAAPGAVPGGAPVPGAAPGPAAPGAAPVPGAAPIPGAAPAAAAPVGAGPAAPGAGAGAAGAAAPAAVPPAVPPPGP